MLRPASRSCIAELSEWTKTVSFATSKYKSFPLTNYLIYVCISKWLIVEDDEEEEEEAKKPIYLLSMNHETHALALQRGRIDVDFIGSKIANWFTCSFLLSFFLNPSLKRLNALLRLHLIECWICAGCR